MTVGDSCDGIFDNGGSINRHNCHIPSQRGWDTMRNVQISQELFMQLLRFHLIEDESCEKEIKKELEKKLDKMVMRDLFGKSKTAPTKEERERARKEYLDRRGTDKSRGKNSDLACRMGRKYRR